MSCTTSYLVVEPDGRRLIRLQKQGLLEFESADELLAHIEEEERQDLPSDASAWLGCQGWFVDRARRVARVFLCQPYRPLLEEERRLQAAPGWAGWDVGVAWEGTKEILARVGAHDPDDDPSLLDGWDGCDAAGHMTCHVDPDQFPHRWDPQAQVLTYGWYGWDLKLDVTVIAADEEVRDHGFTDASLLQAMGRGPALLEELAAVAPCPEPADTPAGLLIDVPQRVLAYWTSESIGAPRDGLGPRMLAEAGRRWPGWRIERERAGPAGRMRRTGREAEDGSEGAADADSPRRAFTYVRTIEVGFDEIGPPPLPEEESRLLAAVYAAPEDDGPRLAYASYLIDRGERRGQFVRVQCELAALEDAGVWSPRRRQLQAEARRLSWCGETSRPRYARFRRGFPAWFNTSVADLVARGALEQAPTLDELVLYGPFGEDEGRALAALSGFERVRSLSVNAVAGLDPVAARGARLRRLTVSLDRPDAEAMRMVCLAAARLPLLEHLGLHHRGWGAEEIAAVLAAARLPALRSLSLYDNGPGVAAAIAAVPACAALRVLSLDLDPDGARALASSPHLDGLVDLEGRALGHPVAELLLAGPGLPALRRLNIRRSALSNAGLARLLAAPGTRRLTSLGFEDAELTPAGWMSLATTRALDGLDDLHFDRVESIDPAALEAVRARFGERFSLGLG